MVAHKTLLNNRKNLLYIEKDDGDHMVCDSNFDFYLIMRKNVPKKVILFNTQREMRDEAFRLGYIV